MCDQDAPDFDEFETPPTDDEGGSIWSGNELPPELLEGSTQHTGYEVDEQTGDRYVAPASDAVQIPATPDDGAARRNAWPARPDALTETNGNGHKDHRSGRRSWTSAEVGQGRHSRVAPQDPTANLSGEAEQMKALASAAARTRNRSKVGHFVAAMVPLTFQPALRQHQVLLPAIPVLVQGAASLALLMFDEGVQPLVVLMPAILMQTREHLVKLVAQGRPVDPKVAASVLDESAATAIEQSDLDTLRYRKNRPALWDDTDKDG